MSFEELVKQFEKEQKHFDCRACEIEAKDEQVKQMPAHICGKDGKLPELNQLKKPKQ